MRMTTRASQQDLQTDMVGSWSYVGSAFVVVSSGLSLAVTPACIMWSLEARKFSWNAQNTPKLLDRHGAGRRGFAAEGEA